MWYRFAPGGDGLPNLFHQSVSFIRVEAYCLDWRVKTDFNSPRPDPKGSGRHDLKASGEARRDNGHPCLESHDKGSFFEGTHLAGSSPSPFGKHQEGIALSHLCYRTTH